MTAATTALAIIQGEPIQMAAAIAATNAITAPTKPHTNHICSIEKRSPQPLSKQ